MRQIPPEILAAARRAGLSRPLWYCGPLIDPNKPRKKTLTDLAEQARKAEADATVRGPSVASQGSE